MIRTIWTIVFLTSVVSVQANFRSQFVRNLTINFNSLIECVPESSEKTNLNKLSLNYSADKPAKLFLYDFQIVDEPKIKCSKSANTYTCRWNDTSYVSLELDDYSFKSKSLDGVNKYSIKAKMYVDPQETEIRAFCVAEAQRAKSTKSLH